MDLSMPYSKLDELKRYPKILTALTDAVYQPDHTIRLDLGELAMASPFALAEAVLFARTHCLAVILVNDTAPPKVP